MARVRALAPMLTAILLCSALAGCLDALTGNDPPTAAMSVDPQGTVKAGDSLTFSAVGSSDPDGDSMTFTWTFGDGNTGTGLTISHSYAQPGEYIARLAVGDGSHEATASMTITVVDASAREPHAEITADRDDDCEGEEPPNGDFVMVWVCEDDKDIGDREVSVSTSVFLDGSDSWAGCDPDQAECYAEEYLVEWNWDLDTHTDTDDDGNPENDVDATGETYEWEDLPAGAWDIRLSVTDDSGFVDHTDSTVYVNYRGVWKDFVIDRRYQDPVIMTWEFPVTYDEDTKDRIRYLRVKLTYPAEDDDQPFGGIDTENKLDLYLYNSTDEEVANTSAIDDDSRNAGDCQDSDRCIWMVVGGSTVRGFLPGGWTVDLVNEKTHNTEIKQMMVELQYR